MTNHIFVYGTLRRGHGACRGFGLETHGRYVRTCELRGAALYHLGGFPGIKITEDDADVVVGDIFEVLKPELMNDLDRYEGYHPDDPDHSLYLRKEIEVDGTKVYTYVYNHEIQNPTTQRIVSGDWSQAV